MAVKVRLLATTDEKGERRRVYDARLRTPDGRQVRKTFRTKTDALKFEREQRSAMDRGGWIDPRAGRTRFDSWAASWLTSNPAKRPTSFARDDSIIRRQLNPVFGEMALRDIGPRHVRTAVNEWSLSLAPRTVKRVYGVLRAILEAAVREDLLTKSPCNRSVKLPSAAPVRCHVIDADELDALAVALGPDMALMAYFGTVLGLRWGEAAGLRVGAIDCLRGVVHVVEQVTRGHGGVAIMSEPKSSAGTRHIAMPQWLTDLAAAHLSRNRLTGAEPTALLFPNALGDPMDYSHWRSRVWLPAVRAANLDGLRFHDLRRAAATVLVAAGVDAKTTQTRMGHSDVRLTLAVYAQATDDRDRAAADAVGAVFTPSVRHIRAIAPA